MLPKERPAPPFDPKSFLAKVGAGRKTMDYGQGQAAVAILAAGDFFGEGRLGGQIKRMAAAPTRARVNFFMNRFRKPGFIDYNGGQHVHRSLSNVALYG